MKQLKLILFACFLFSSLQIFPQNWEWGKHIKGSGDTFNQLTNVDGDGNIIVAGATIGETIFEETAYNLNPTKNTPFLAKFNPEGTIVWLVNIGDKDDANIKGLSIDNQGNIIISGQFMSTTEPCSFGSTNTTGSNPIISLTSAGDKDGYFAKYDSDGNLIWAHAIVKGALEDRSFGVATDSDNNIFISGFFRSSSVNIFRKDLSDSTITKTVGSNSDGYIIKFSPDASYIWHKQFSSPTYARNQGGLASAPNDGVYVGIDFTTSVSVVGTDPLITKSAIGTKAMAIFRVNSNGSINWSTVVRGSTTAGNVYNANNYTSDNDGNLYAIGGGNTIINFENANGEVAFQNQTVNNSEDGWLVKYSPTGIAQWANTFGSNNKDEAESVSFRNGVISVAGYYMATVYLPTQVDNRDTLANSGGQDIFLINYNSDGQYLGSAHLGGSGDDEASSVTLMPEGNSIVGASFKSASLDVPGDSTHKNGGLRDMFLGKHINIHFLPEETPISCNNGNNGALTFTTFGGGEAPYSYSFAKVGGSVIGSGTYSNPVTFQNLEAGTYYVDITDNQTRSIRKYYKIKNPTPITITGNVVNVGGCYADQTGEINITVSGGTAPYTYLWDSENGYGYIPTVEDQSNVTAGDYKITVIDANGCEAEKTFTVTQPAKINFTGSGVPVNNTSSDPALPNGSITPAVNNGSAPITYSWQGPNGFTSTDANLTGLRGGSYILTVTANGCIADTMFCLLDANLLNACISEIHNPKCKGGSDGSATVSYFNAIGGVTLAWSNGQTDVVTATGLSAGNYTVTVTDNNGSITIPFVVGEPQYLLDVTTTLEKTTCPNNNDGSIHLSINGWSMPYTYTWSTSDGSGIVDGQKDQEGLTAGVYSVVVADIYGCEVTKNLNLGSEYSSPSITLAATPSNVVTEGTAVTLTASGGSIYEFFIDDVSQGIPSASDNIVISNPVNNTRIKAVGYNTAGCSGESNEVTLTVNPITYAVTFTVTNKTTSSPIENAQITIGSDSPILTNSSGVAAAQKANGTYSYTATATTYYDITGDFTVTDANVDIPIQLTSTGINDNSLVGLNVYPNPFNTEIKFTLTDKISRVEVSNILGQKVIDINTHGANSVSTQEIPNGIYLIKFTAKNGDTIVRKLLKDNR